MNLPTLYHEARTGKLHSWRIWTEGADMVEEYGTVDGAKTQNRRTCKGKNVGKANETTPEEQAEREAAAKHQKKLDKGYSESRTEARETVFLPMLAHDWSKQKNLPEFPVDLQPKLDGVRCLAHWDGSKHVRLMSRGGKEYSVEHISLVLETILPKGVVLDGELYIHGLPLQTITALVKKHREVGDEEYPMGSIALEYHVYDAFKEDNPDMPWKDRELLLMQVMKRAGKLNKVHLVPCLEASELEQIPMFLENYEKAGFEGLIARVREGKYTLGHRSRDLLKLKSFLDAEFEIVGFEEASGNDKGTVVWRCQTDEGKDFTVRPMGTRKERAKLLQEGDSHIGELLTVKFQAWTKDKMPQFPVGVAIRGQEDMS